MSQVASSKYSPKWSRCWRIRGKDLDEAAALQAKQEAERLLANRTDAMDIAEAEAKLVEALAQLQALERLRKNLKH